MQPIIYAHNDFQKKAHNAWQFEEMQNETTKYLLDKTFKLVIGQCYNLSCQLSVNIEYGYPIQHYFILIKDSVFFKSDNSI